MQKVYVWNFSFSNFHILKASRINLSQHFNPMKFFFFFLTKSYEVIISFVLSGPSHGLKNIISWEIICSKCPNNLVFRLKKKDNTYLSFFLLNSDENLSGATNFLEKLFGHKKKSLENSSNILYFTVNSLVSRRKGP